MGNVLWFGIVIFKKIKNVSFFDRGCITFIVWFSIFLIIGIVRLNEVLKVIIKESELIIYNIEVDVRFLLDFILSFLDDRM